MILLCALCATLLVRVVISTQPPTQEPTQQPPFMPLDTAPWFVNGQKTLQNNSYIYYADISDGDNALKCVTDNPNCCTDSDGDWTDETGTVVHQGGPDDSSCLYVTRGYQEISLNRKSDCIPDTSGLWRCDIDESNDEIQSIYIYISNDNTSGILQIVSISFSLHTELTVSPPEFSIICRTHGGPATTVEWFLPVPRDGSTIEYNSSQIIVDTSHSVYDNTLVIRGREDGNYQCRIGNSIYFPSTETMFVLVAGDPTNLTAESNSTHVTVSWKSPGGPVTGYVIYYQPEGRYKSSVNVSGGETESHSLDCLEGGVTYYISIVALSDHLPSPLVGPVNVTPEVTCVSTSNRGEIAVAHTTMTLTSSILTSSVMITTFTTIANKALPSTTIITNTSSASTTTTKAFLLKITSSTSKTTFLSTMIMTSNSTTTTEVTILSTMIMPSITRVIPDTGNVMTSSTSNITNIIKVISSTKIKTSTTSNDTPATPFITLDNEAPFYNCSNLLSGIIGGVMGLVIICQSVAIAILLIQA